MGRYSFFRIAGVAIGATLLLSAAADARDIKTAVVAGGCFWCVESDFEAVPGVVEAVSGFAGGKTKDPTYKQVTKGGTGHYEAVRITYDADKLSYRKLLDLFLRSVDPTDAGGQFCDRGASYKTAIFAGNASETEAAKAAVADAGAALGKKIVTPVLRAKTFWLAEDYHQDYYKSIEVVITRRGPKSKREAYKFYRKACGRDASVKKLWGAQAAFAK